MSMILENPTLSDEAQIGGTDDVPTVAWADTDVEFQASAIKNVRLSTEGDEKFKGFSITFDFDDATFREIVIWDNDVPVTVAQKLRELADFVENAG